MSLSLAVLLALGGLGLLVVCGDRLVTGSLALARHFGLSPLVVGMFIIGLGTSLPEIILSVQAALSGYFGIAHGNIIGSNIANVLLVLGAAALIAPVLTQTPELRGSTLLMLAVTLLWIGITPRFGLNPLTSMVFFAILIRFVYISPPSAQTDFETRDTLPHLWLEAVKIVLCLIGLPIGAQMLIKGGTDIAQLFGISDAVIGQTLIAIGTSLPELAAALAAATRRQTGLIIGNVLGSNLFNILAAGGAIGLIGQQYLNSELIWMGHLVMGGAALFLTGLVMRRIAIGRSLGIVFLIAYGSYVALLF